MSFITVVPAGNLSFLSSAIFPTYESLSFEISITLPLDGFCHLPVISSADDCAFTLVETTASNKARITVKEMLRFI